MFPYPLHLTFKVWTLSPNRISIKDDSGNVLLVLRQKAFKLKEVINIYRDEELTQPVYEIRADRIIDFSARYSFSDTAGNDIGSIKRQGLRSIWRARYDIFDNTNTTSPSLIIQEENPWVKVIDSLLCEIPVVGLFSGYFFNPSYTIGRPDSNNVVMRIEKKPGFLSRHFVIKMVDRLDDREELRAVLSMLMMILLERNRG
jgi:hypothetical protein